MPAVLPLHLGELADLDIAAEPVGRNRRQALGAEADPGLVDVDLAVARGRVAVVEVIEVDLGVGLHRLAPPHVRVQREHGELQVVARIDRRDRSTALPRRQHVRREGEVDREAVGVAVPVVGLGFDAEMDPAVSLGRRTLVVGTAGDGLLRSRRAGDQGARGPAGRSPAPRGARGAHTSSPLGSSSRNVRFEAGPYHRGGNGLGGGRAAGDGPPAPVRGPAGRAARPTTRPWRRPPGRRRRRRSR